MAKVEVCPRGSARNNPTFQPLPSLGVGKGQQAAPTSPKILILPTISPSPSPCGNQMHNRPWPAVYKSALADKNTFVTYSTPNSGASVDLWKKVAKKAELELHLERNNHRADSTKDHHIIHRLSRRMIPVEKALGKSKAVVKQQDKQIEDLKSKMLSASEKAEAELSYLRLQNLNMQRYLNVAAENDTGKEFRTPPDGDTDQITELEEELHQANSSAGALKEQMDQIYKIVNDPPEVLNNHSTGDCEKCDSRPTDTGLAVLARVKVICHNNDQLRKQLRDRDEKLPVVAEENERLWKAADEAARRTNTLVNFVASLRQERDMAVSQLKKTEDMVESINDLEDLVRSCTSPRDWGFTLLAQKPRTPTLRGPVPLQTIQSRPTLKQTVRCTEENSKHVAPTEEKTPQHHFLSETEDATDLSAMRSVPGKTVVYCKTMSGEELRTTGATLVSKLHAAFSVLLSKLEASKQTTAGLQRENEDLRSAMQEAYEGLKGGKLSECISPDDYNVALLVAVGEFDKSIEGLRREKAVLEALKLEYEKKIMDLESQTQNLTLDKKALLETMQVMKNVMRASNAKEELKSYSEGISNRTKIHGESPQEIVEILMQENNEARSTCLLSKEDKELQEEEPLRLQSLDVSRQLQVEKDSLDTQLQDLKEHCQFHLQAKSIFAESQAGCNFLQDETDVLYSEFQELQKENQNIKVDIMLKEDSVKACENDLERRVHIGGKSVDKSSCSYILEALRCTLTAATLGGKVTRAFSMTSGEEEESSSVVTMAQQLVDEVKGARSASETLKGQRQELSEVRGLYCESKSLCVQLQSEIEALEFAMQDLHKSVQSIKRVLDEGMNTSDLEEVENWKIFWKADGLVHEKVVNGVSSLLQRLKTAERSFREIEHVIGVKGQPLTDLQSKAAHILIFMKSLGEDRELASVALRGFNDLLPFVKQHLKRMVDLLSENDSNSPVAEQYPMTPSKDEPVNFKEVVKSASDFRAVVEVLPSLIQKIRELKTENDSLPADLQALELEKLAITCTSKENHEKLNIQCNSAQLEIHHLKEQLAAVESPIAFCVNNSTEYRETGSYNVFEGNRGVQIEQTPLLTGLVSVKNELFVLGREKSDAGVRAGDLELRLVSEQEKGNDLARVLSTTEAHTQTSTNRAIAAEAVTQNLTSQIEALQKGVTDSKAELCVQGELLKIEKSKWAILFEDQRTEIVRLGGFDVADCRETIREETRRGDAAEKVKQVLSKDHQISSLRQLRGGTSPLTLLTTFTVDLLVNGKIFNQLEVGGYTGGLCHGVIHYFSVSDQTGNITFADSIMPGSQSSNMVADVCLVPKDDQKLYCTEPGDVLGLQIKVSSIEDRTPREALYNSSIVRTNQVLDAIKGKTVKTFTMWPDLVSCWRWERGKTKVNSWNLISVRWRFLMKTIFPDLIESLQALAVPGSATRPRVPTIVAM